MLLPLRIISSVISKVMFPAFSKKHDEILIIKMHYLRIVKYIATVTFPIMLGLAFVSKEFVLIFFGEKWKGMIPILSILSGIGAIQSILSLNGLIYNSLAKNRIAFKVSIVVNIVLVVSFFIGIQFGLIGLTWSYFIASLLIFIPTYHIAISQINTSLMEVYCVLKGLIFATSGVAIVLLVSNYYFSFSLVLSLALKCSFSVFIYILLLFVFEKSYTKQLIFQAFKIIKNTK
jgi:PST family polysaccharide transporter